MFEMCADAAMLQLDEVLAPAVVRNTIKSMAYDKLVTGIGENEYVPHMADVRFRFDTGTGVVIVNMSWNREKET
jgi:hypothetical protein